MFEDADAEIFLLIFQNGAARTRVALQVIVSSGLLDDLNFEPDLLMTT
jgi:hypothetical protein